MESALRGFSRRGMYVDTVSAISVRSREHYRKLWPLFDPHDRRHLVTWVRPSFEGNRCVRRSHFRRLNTTEPVNLVDLAKAEEISRRSIVESEEHRHAKKMLAETLRRFIRENRSLVWAFSDPDASDFSIKGNLLLAADTVLEEHTLEMPFGDSFRLDVAVLGPPVGSLPILLGGIEIEFGHPFDGRKALLCKSIGVPLISIDISEMSVSQMDQAWADSALSLTTAKAADGRRKTFVYLHELSYPTFCFLPDNIADSDRHQFLIFSQDTELERLKRTFDKVAKALNFSKTDVVMSIVNAKSKQAQRMLDEAGLVVGGDWRDINSNKCLRVTLPRPKHLKDRAAILMHLIMTRILISETDALVGYKYRRAIQNVEQDEDCWFHYHWNSAQRQHEKIKILPKRLSEPMNNILELASGIATKQPK